MWQFTLLAVGIQLLLHCNTALPPDYCHCNTYSYEYMYQATSGIVELPGANLFTASLSSHEFLSGDGDQMLPDARIGPMICTLGYGATRHRQRRNLVNSVHIVSRTSYIFTRYSIRTLYNINKVHQYGKHSARKTARDIDLISEDNWCLLQVGATSYQYKPAGHHSDHFVTVVQSD